MSNLFFRLQGVSQVHPLVLLLAQQAGDVQSISSFLFELSQLLGDAYTVPSYYSSRTISSWY